jgi:hypothetical protein
MGAAHFGNIGWTAHRALARQGCAHLDAVNLGTAHCGMGLGGPLERCGRPKP